MAQLTQCAPDEIKATADEETQAGRGGQGHEAASRTASSVGSVSSSERMVSGDSSKGEERRGGLLQTDPQERPQTPRAASSEEMGTWSDVLGRMELARTFVLWATLSGKTLCAPARRTATAVIAVEQGGAAAGAQGDVEATALPTRSRASGDLESLKLRSGAWGEVSPGGGNGGSGSGERGAVARMSKAMDATVVEMAGEGKTPLRCSIGTIQNMVRPCDGPFSPSSGPLCLPLELCFEMHLGSSADQIIVRACVRLGAERGCN